MTHTASPPTGVDTPRDRSYDVEPTEMTAWVGWVAFAGVMLWLVGSFHAIAGLVALFRDEVYLVGSSGLTLKVDYTTWGWIHLIGGSIVAAAGIAVFTGRLWARIVGVTVAMLSALVNIAFLEAYPVWSAIMIAIDVLVIWALMVHGDEVKH